MSVINTMLKDLDKRQQGHPVEDIVNAPLQYHSKPSSRLPWILLALVSLLLLIGVVINWQQLQQIKLQTQTDSLASARSASHPVSKEPLAGKEPSANQEPSADKEPSVDKERLADDPIPASKTLPNTEESVAKQTQPDNQRQTDDPAPTLKITESQDRQQIEVTAPVEKQPITTKQSTATVVSSPRANSSVANSPHATGTMAVKEVKLTNAQLANKRLALGTEAENQGLQPDAELYYAEALQLNNGLHQARKQLAALYYGQGQLSLAVQILNQGITLYPQHYEYALLAAKVYEAGESYELALDALSRVPDQAGYLKQKLTLQSVLAQKSQQYSLSADSYRQLARMEPQQARWWMGLAYALDAQQDYVSAKAAYQQALSQRGLSGEAVNYIESRLAQLGEIE